MMLFWKISNFVHPLFEVGCLSKCYCYSQVYYIIINLTSHFLCFFTNPCYLVIITLRDRWDDTAACWCRCRWRTTHIPLPSKGTNYQTPPSSISRHSSLNICAFHSCLASLYTPIIFFLTKHHGGTWSKIDILTPLESILICRGLKDLPYNKYRK